MQGKEQLQIPRALREEQTPGRGIFDPDFDSSGEGAFKRARLNPKKYFSRIIK